MDPGVHGNRGDALRVWALLRITRLPFPHPELVEGRGKPMRAQHKTTCDPSTGSIPFLVIVGLDPTIQ